MYRGQCNLPPQNSREYRILLTAIGYFEIDALDLDHDSSISEFDTAEDIDDSARNGLRI